MSIVNLLSIGFSNALMEFFAILLGTSILSLMIFNPNAGRPRFPVTHKSSSIFAFDLSRTLFLFTSPKTVTLIDNGPLEVSPPISSTLNSLQHSKKPFENCFNQSLFAFGIAMASNANIGDAPIAKISETLTAIAFHPILYGSVSAMK